MKELVDKNKFRDSLIHCHGLGRKSLELVLKCLNEQEIEEVQTGEWIKCFAEHEFMPSKRVLIGYECSECGHYIRNCVTIDNYCGNCGSKNEIVKHVHEFKGEENG